MVAGACQWLGVAMESDVHGGIVEDLADVFRAFGLALLAAENRGDAFVDRAAIHIAHVGNLRIRLPQKPSNMIHPPPVGAHDSDPDLVVRAFRGPEHTDGSEESDATARDAGLSDELPAVEGERNS